MNAQSAILAKITQHYFEFNGRKYFRENAHSVRLGDCGEKKDPAGARGYIDVQRSVSAEALEGRVRFNTSAEINWNDVTEGLLGINGFLKAFGLNNTAAATFTFENAKTARLKLMNFEIDEQPLKTMLNKAAGAARRYLADEGNDGRICSGIWVWAEGEVAEHFATSAMVEAIVDGGTKGVSIIAKGGRRGTETISLTPGTTFAYKLHKVKDWNRGKTGVENLEADWKGNG